MSIPMVAVLLAQTTSRKSVYVEGIEDNVTDAEFEPSVVDVIGS